MRSGKKFAWLAAGLAVLAYGSFAQVQAEDLGPNESPAHEYCPDEPHETGFQGENLGPASCGVSIVAQLPGAGGPLTRAGDCAFTGGGGGVRVIDISDPANPEQVDLLPTSVRENISAVKTSDRSVLMTRRRDAVRHGPMGAPGVAQDVLIDIWDVSNCLVSGGVVLKHTFRLPTQSDVYGDPPADGGGPAHNVMLNPTGTKAYASDPLIEMDISDWEHPENWTQNDIKCEIVSQSYPAYAVPGTCEQLEGKAWRFPSFEHEPAFNASGSRFYSGGLIPGPQNNNIHIIDTTTQPWRVVKVVEEEATGHSIDWGRVHGATEADDREILIHSAEIGAPPENCVPGSVRPTHVGTGLNVFILDITDEQNPRRASTLELAINKPEACLAGKMSVAATHYHTINNGLNAKFALISWTSAGLRIWDIRNPEAPTEVAYFNHGSSSTDPLYDSETGLIYLSAGGHFWVLKLSDTVRGALGLGAGE